MVHWPAKLRIKLESVKPRIEGPKPNSMRLSVFDEFIERAFARDALEFKGADLIGFILWQVVADSSNIDRGRAESSTREARFTVGPMA